jgi:hypothetical protein
MRASGELAPSTRRSAARRLPRIDHVDLEICKVARVSRGQRRMPCKHDPGDLGIVHVDRPTRSLPLRGQLGGFISGPGVEIQDTILQILCEQARERGFQGLPPLAIRKQGETETGLEQRDARDPDRLRRLSVQPSSYCRVRHLVHQRRKYVRVDADHVQ